MLMFFEPNNRSFLQPRVQGWIKDHFQNLSKDDIIKDN